MVFDVTGALVNPIALGALEEEGPALDRFGGVHGVSLVLAWRQGNG
jgi:hypothetical protein